VVTLTRPGDETVDASTASGSTPCTRPRASAVRPSA
jgi:hypothetical protein